MLIDDVAAWVEDVLGESATVVIANQNGDAVSGATVLLTEISSTPLGWPQFETSIDEESGDVSMSAEQFEEMTIQFDALASNGHELLRTIIARAFFPDCPGSVNLLDYGDIRDLTALEDSAFSPRYSCDLTFATISETSAVVPTVDTVHITSDDFDEMTSEVGEEPPEEETP